LAAETSALLAPWQSRSTSRGGAELAADGIAMRVGPAPDAEPEREGDATVFPADLVFELEQGLRAGHRGSTAAAP
jgi:hypothetical protein